jgi:hypothetical protein
MTCDQIKDPARDAPMERLYTARFEWGKPSRSDGYVCPIFQGHKKRENFADRVSQIRVAKDHNFAGRDVYTVTDSGSLTAVRKGQNADTTMGGLKSLSDVCGFVR